MDILIESNLRLLKFDLSARELFYLYPFVWLFYNYPIFLKSIVYTHFAIIHIMNFLSFVEILLYLKKKKHLFFTKLFFSTILFLKNCTSFLKTFFLFNTFGEFYNLFIFQTLFSLNFSMISSYKLMCSIYLFMNSFHDIICSSYMLKTSTHTL